MEYKGKYNECVKCLNMSSTECVNCSIIHVRVGRGDMHYSKPSKYKMRDKSIEDNAVYEFYFSKKKFIEYALEIDKLNVKSIVRFLRVRDDDVLYNYKLNKGDQLELSIYDDFIKVGEGSTCDMVCRTYNEFRKRYPNIINVLKDGDLVRWGNNYTSINGEDGYYGKQE